MKIILKVVVIKNQKFWQLCLFRKRLEDFLPVINKKIIYKLKITAYSFLSNKTRAYQMWISEFYNRKIKVGPTVKAILLET